MQVSDFLLRLLTENLSDEKMQWVRARIKHMEQGIEKELFFAFSSAPRAVGKGRINVTDEQELLAHRFCENLDLQNLTADLVARWLLLLNYTHEDADKYVSAVKKMFSAADVNEQVALYRALPILHFPEMFVSQAAEGVRNNIKTAFEAAVLDNPYPAIYLDENAWNQLVLKAFFVESPVYRIVGLDARANPKLAATLIDYVHERWAAGRKVNPELWRLVGPFIELSMFDSLCKIFHSRNPEERIAAALACASSTLPEARMLLESDPKINDAIDRGKISWETFALQLYKNETELSN